MKKEEIEKELSIVNAKIGSLQAKRDQLDKDLIEAIKTETQDDPFPEQFRAWYNSTASKEMLDWIPSKSEFPKIRAWVDEHDFNRYQTVHIMEYMEDELWFLTHPEDYAREYSEGSEYLTAEDKERIIGLAKELMENNIEGFTLDW